MTTDSNTIVVDEPANDIIDVEEEHEKVGVEGTSAYCEN